VRRYITRLFLHALWFDLILSHGPLRRLRSDPLTRWAARAREFRELAVELGGVLIKLGQFLSTRVDVLPVEVTRELSGLQDRVPPVPFSAVAARIEEDFGRPAEEVFSEIEVESVGAASLAQVHRARLATRPERPDRPGRPGRSDGDTGSAVVVKVLRPGIETLVETDLAAVRLAVRWLKLWGPVRRRVDLDRLFEEFAATTRAELDLTREAANAERFAEMFRDDPGIRAPAIHWQQTAHHTLTLEDVGFLRISDHRAIDEAGVSRAEVARALYRAYMEQLFVHHYVHCDPHPGNLFIRPLEPSEAGSETGPGAGSGGETGRPFQIVFVDFGMMTSIPSRLWEALSETVIALGTRDARRLTRAYRNAGVLLPGADLERLEEVHELFFDRLWGVKLADLQGVALAEAGGFLREYRDLVYEAPFQFPVDLLFTFRAVGLLAGLSISLDPEFDPWAETLPFAEELGGRGAVETVRRAVGEAGHLARLALRLPAGIERVLTLAEHEGIAVRAHLAEPARREVRRLERAAGRIAWFVAAGALFLGGIQIDLARPDDPAAHWLWGAAAVCALWGLLRR
jgi:predicted unusual protein kinase regulating ubiquinone biosynthesis (AarF/ABC1/UbiB family)